MDLDSEVAIVIGKKLWRIGWAVALVLAVSMPPLATAQDKAPDLTTASGRTAAATMLMQDLGELMIAAGVSTPEDVAAGMAAFPARMAGTEPTLEDLYQILALGRGVLGQAAQAAADSGDSEAADRLNAAADAVLRTNLLEPGGLSVLAQSADVFGSASGDPVPARASETAGREQAAGDGTAGTAAAAGSAGASDEPLTVATDERPAARAAEAVTIVFDGSNSMWGQIEGRPKIEIAREALAELVSGWEGSVELGLMAFGHRREGDCSDIETLRPPGPPDALKFVLAVGGITPKGKSPISAAVRQAAAELDSDNRRATVILFSDGVETCGGDPCALAAELEARGVDFTAHVIGFGVEGDPDQLSCLAEASGGLYLAAENTAELNRALSTVRTFATEPEAATLITLEAVDAGTGEVIRQGVSWRLVSLLSEDSTPISAGVSRPSLPLEPGRFIVEARLGDTLVRREITVSEGQSGTIRLAISRDQPAAEVSAHAPVAESEPNSSFGRATKLPWGAVPEGDGSSFGTAISVAPTGRIAASVPSDRAIWRRIAVPGEGALSLRLGAAPAGGVVTVRIWNDEKSALSDWLDFATGTAQFDLPRAGTYALEIRSAGAAGDLALDIAFTATGDSFEPNNSFGTAAALALSDPFEFAILPRGDADWMRIEVPDQGRLTLALDGAAPADVQPVVRLWSDEKGTMTGWLDISAGMPATLDLPRPGSYVLELRDRAEDGRATDLIKLIPRFVPTGDALEPDDSFGTAAMVDVNGRVRFSIFPRGDSDWMKVSLPDQGRLTMALPEPATGVAPVVRVWNWEKSALTDWLDLSTGPVTHDAAAAGDYVLEWRDKGDDHASPEAFAVDLSFAPTGESGEPNGSLGRAAPFEPGAALSGSFLPRGDADFRSFAVDSHGRLTLTLAGQPEGIDVSLRLWNAEKSALTGWLKPREGPVALDLPAPGQYWLELRDSGDDGAAPESYRLETAFVSARVAPGPAGMVLAGTIFPRGDADFFELAVATPGMLTIAPVELPPDQLIVLRLWNAEKSVLTGWLDLLVNGAPTPVEFEVKKPGVLRLEVRAKGDASGSTNSYRLRVGLPGD